jgi:hypothetical protein
MADDILRLRATVVSDEALANIRAIGREIGIIPQRAGRGVAQMNSQFVQLGQTIRNVGREVSQVVPGLSMFGLGAAGVGASVALLLRSFSQTAEKMVELKYSSKELGYTTQQLMGLEKAFEKVGIAPQQLTQSLESFKKNTEDFDLRIGSVRQELLRFRGSEVLSGIMNARGEMNKLLAAFDYAKELDAEGRAAEAKRLMETLGLDYRMLRLTREQMIESINRQPIISEEDKRRAQEYSDKLKDLNTSFEGLQRTMGLKAFPFLTNLSQELDEWMRGDFSRFSKALADDPAYKFLTTGQADDKAVIIDIDLEPVKQKLSGFQQWMEDNVPGLARTMRGERLRDLDRNILAPPEYAPEVPPELQTRAAPKGNRLVPTPRGGSFDERFGFPTQQQQSTTPAAGGPPGFQRIAYRPGEDGGFQHMNVRGGDGGTAMDEFTRAIKQGVFDALVDFQSYVNASSGGGGVPGITRASLTTGSYGGGGGGPAGSAIDGGGGGGPPGTSTGGGAPNGSSIPRPGKDGAGGGGGGGGGSFIDALAEIESGNKNIPSGVDPDVAGPGTKSQGYFQINTPTWRDFAPKAGIDLKQYPNAMSAPREVQAQVAGVIPFSRFGPRTQRMMQQRFGNLDRKATVGDLATRFGPQGAPNGSSIPRPEGGGQGNTVEEQGKVAGVRKGELDPKLRAALDYAGEQTGLSARVFSGGQRMPGAEGATGSHRHDQGRAGDFKLYDADGRIVPPDDPRALAFTEAASRAGVIGGGAGYMADPRSIHLDIAGGRGGAKGAYAGSPAFRGAMARGIEQQQAFAQQQEQVRKFREAMPAPTTGSEAATRRPEGSTVEAAPRAPLSREDQPVNINYRRIDGAVAPQSNVTGNVNVTVNSNGTKAKTDVKGDDFWQGSTVKQHRQMQRTEDASEGLNI